MTSLPLKTMSKVQVSEEDESSEYANDAVYVENSVLLNGMSIGFAEFFGTAMIVFISCMSCMPNMSREKIPVLQMSLTGGLSVMTVIQIFAHISGAFVNPAVTVCGIIMGETTLKTAVIYFSAQITGSVTGYALLLAVSPKIDIDNNGHCLTLPHEDISLFQAFLVELIATFIMCMAICSSWDCRNSTRTDSISLRIGLLVAMLGCAAGPYTGASMNPARSFGPAIWNGNFRHHWIYWFGPLFGGALSSYFYKKIFMNKDVL